MTPRPARPLALILPLLATLACKPAEPITSSTVDSREAIQIAYVRPASMTVRVQPSADAAVVSTYSNGETISVLARRDGWAEIRTGAGSGWVHDSDLAADHKTTQLPDNATPRFRRAPQPITGPATHGTIVLEASVDRNGEVVSVRTVTNSTGSHPLEVKNTAALRQASFYPIVRNGEKQEFIYQYRLHY